MLYNKYYEPILVFVYQRVDSKDAAFDITQQVFLKAMINLSKYEFKGVPFSAWLYRMAINDLNQIFRNNKTQRAINVDIDSVEEMIEEMQEENKEEKHQLIVNALTELDDEEVQLIEMRFFEKRAFKEVGEILNITENNAKVKLYRVLDKLKKTITANK